MHDGDLCVVVSTYFEHYTQLRTRTQVQTDTHISTDEQEFVSFEKFKEMFESSEAEVEEWQSDSEPSSRGEHPTFTHQVWGV